MKRLMAGAMDVDPNVAKSYGASLGLDPSRAYGTWQEMLQGEQSRDDHIDLVTVATPNATHFEISKAFLEAGFHVLCEKPMTMTVPEAQALVQIAKKANRACAVNYGYSGYPLVRQMKAMVEAGQLGAIRCVFGSEDCEGYQEGGPCLYAGSDSTQYKVCNATEPFSVVIVITGSFAETVVST